MNGMFNFFAGGAALGLIAGFWGYIKAVLWRIANLFVQQVEIHSEAAHEAVIAHLVTHYPRSRTYDRMYGAVYEHHRDGRYGLVPFELFGNRSLLFWNGWFPFVFANKQESQPQSKRKHDDDDEAPKTRVFSTITFVRCTLNVEKIFQAACTERNQLTWSWTTTEEQTRNRFVIHRIPDRDDDDDDHEGSSHGLPWYQNAAYRLLNHTPEQLGKGRLHEGTALENLIFPQRVKDLIREIALWCNNRDWYRQKGIPWKRGWLLYGPPGTGKTALARAFAEDLNMPIYVFNLAEMSNHELIDAWSDMQVNVPCIALIEDIDNVFHGRENVAWKNGMMPFARRRRSDYDDDDDQHPFIPLTFDCLLNCLDGVERADGIFTIITTNDINKVDPALGQPGKQPDGSVEFISTRPGRIDKAVELTYMEAQDKKRLAQRILGEFPEEHRAMVQYIDRYPDLQETPAQFQERCGQIALAAFWKEQEAGATTLPLRKIDGRSQESAVSVAGNG